MIKETIKMSLNNIIYNKMRSFLTVLGIVIGVASVIALITIVQGTTSSVTKKVKSLGADKITVRATGTPLKQGLLDSDIKNLNKLKNVVGVSPSINGISSVAYERQVKEDVNVQGKNEVYFNKTDNLVKSGRGINIIDSESKNKVCLIGKNIKNEVFFSKDPIGKQMKIGEISYTIIGTLEESNNFSMNSSDNTVIIPYTTAMSFLSTRYINDIDVYMKNSDLADSTTSNVETVLKQAFNYNEDGYSVSNMESMLETIKEMTRMLSLMLGGIASISLIVGGIGIMNMMLISVTERTTEIGLRKALGAEPRAIQQQFLIEAVFLSLLGGIIGLIFGSLIAYLVCYIIGSEFLMSISTIILAIGFSVVIGIVFGLAPARKASKLNPIDALRSV